MPLRAHQKILLDFTLLFICACYFTVYEKYGNTIAEKLSYFLSYFPCKFNHCCDFCGVRYSFSKCPVTVFSFIVCVFFKRICVQSHVFIRHICNHSRFEFLSCACFRVQNNPQSARVVHLCSKCWRRVANSMSSLGAPTTFLFLAFSAGLWRLVLQLMCVFWGILQLSGTQIITAWRQGNMPPTNNNRIRDAVSSERGRLSEPVLHN